MEDLQSAFLEVIEESEWMDDSTKTAAANKANEMITLLAFPDFVENATKVDEYYENLRVCSWDHFGNSQRLRAFSKALDYSTIDKARDKELYVNFSRKKNRFLNNFFLFWFTDGIIRHYTQMHFTADNTIECVHFFQNSNLNY